MKLCDQVPIFDTTQRQLKELAEIREARGEIVSDPVTIIAILVHLELLKEKKNEIS